MSGQRRSFVPLLIAAIVGLGLILGVRFLVTGGSDSASDPGSEETVVPDGDCTALTVVASSEKAGLLREVANGWNRDRRESDGRCVYAEVVSKASGGAAVALAEPQWDEVVEGPRPDVWSPASSSWAGLTRQWRAQEDLPDIIPDQAGSVAQTPLVIAMPRPMAEALGWPDKQIGWQDLAALAKNPQGWGAEGHPEWGAFKLGKTNPHFSTSGLNATIGAYFAATGLSSDLAVDDVRAKDTRTFVRDLEKSAVHYGDTTLTFLDNMAQAAEQGRGLSYVSAVTVEEKSVLDYNQGNPTGNPETAGQQPEPTVPLVAVYPKEGTLLSDNPWYVLDAEWVDDTKRQAADDLLAYVQSEEVQKRFQEAGFRDFEGKPGDVLSTANGFIADQPDVVLSAPAPPVLGEVLDSWDELRKRARVLLVMDVSGSMGQPVPEAGASRLELATDAAAQAVDMFADNDDVGLWIFSTELAGNGDPWLSLVPVAPASQTRSPIQNKVSNLIADGGTALYATTREAHKQMLADLDTGRINAIVLLSDGRNEYPPDTDLDGLLRKLSGESADTTVRVFTIGYSEGADAAALEAIADASSAEYYDASDPTTIRNVLTSVLSNF